MEYMYALLFVLAGSPVLASVYAAFGEAEGPAKGGAKEGMARGIESFARGVFELDATIENGGVQQVFRGNCYLIAPDQIVTCKHLLEKGELLERNPDRLSIVGNFPGGRKFAMPIKTFKAHPDLDLAIATLEEALPSDRIQFTILPMLLEHVSPTSGYMVSVNDVYVLGTKDPVERDTRHISILQSVKEEAIPLQHGEPAPVLWTKDWPIPGKGSAAAMADRLFIPRAGDHRLIACPMGGDSGAPFVVRYDGTEMLGAIYTSTLFCSRADESRVALSCMIPLYTAADWIRANS